MTADLARRFRAVRATTLRALTALLLGLVLLAPTLIAFSTTDAPTCGMSCCRKIGKCCCRRAPQPGDASHGLHWKQATACPNSCARLQTLPVAPALLTAPAANGGFAVNPHAPLPALPPITTHGRELSANLFQRPPPTV